MRKKKHGRKKNPALSLEKNFRLLLEKVPAVLWTTDSKLRITSLRGLGLKGLHLEPDSWMGKTLYDYFETKDPHHLYIQYHLKALAGESVTYEAQLDGRFFHAHIDPLLDSRGKHRGTIGFALDITDRKKAELKRERSLSLLRATLESTTDGILVVNLKGEIVSFNQKFIQMWRIPESIAQSRDDSRAISYVLDQLKDPESFVTKIRELYSRPDAVSFDVLEFKDGRIFERYSQPQRIGEEIIGRVWSFRDVTERKQMEHALQKQKNENQIIFDSVPAMIWYKDSENRLLRVNRLAAESMGHSVKEIEGRSAREFFPDEADKYYRDDLEVIHSGKPKLGIIEPYQIQSGEKKWVKTDKIPYRDEDGKITGVIVFATDITDMKRTQEMLHKTVEELARSNKELEQFAYVASHDLQEPLHKIIAFGERLQSIYRSRFDERGLDYLERMGKASKRMRQLIEDLLRFARVTTRAHPFETVNLETVLQEVISDLELRIGESKAEIEMFPLPCVRADRLQIYQLFQNILVNALKFAKKTPPPRIIIEAKDLKNNWVEISIQDNGVGFDEKYFEKIFLPFQRLHGRSEYEGSGMGLAICKKIVERHGGQISARGALEKGATFLFTLPLQEEGDRQLNGK